MDIFIGENILERLKAYLEELKANTIYSLVDERVYRLHGKKIIGSIEGFNNIFYTLPASEDVKSLDYVQKVYDDLIEKKIDRQAVILSIGGGVIGDFSGFIASTFKRGIRYIQVPTSLLAQVDSSIGGKVAINYGGYKNIIGSFYFPEAAFIDISFLKTLDRREITSGLGEILKYGLIYDYGLFRFVRGNMDRIYNIYEEVLLPIIERAVSIKDRIVEEDERDRGLRRILNFGHTVGHAIESYFEFNRYNHGEGVILGIIYESYMAKEMGLIGEEYFKEIYATLRDIVNPIRFNDNEVNELLNIMENDKKNEKGNIVFILPIGRGKVDIFYNIEKGLIKNTLKGEWIED